tara:strand:- start:68 stop:319 length:252 start_codon:yes stop_codon:yes gene_type:complete
LLSIKRGIVSYTGFCASKGGGVWFNTGGGGGKKYWLQYGNTVILATLFVLFIYRIFAFLYVDDGCEGWATFGTTAWLSVAWLV